MFLNSIFKKIFFVFVLSIVCISAYSNEDKKCEKGFTSKSLEDRIRSAHVAKLNTGNKGSDTNTDSSRSTLRDRTRAVARAVADTARRVTPSEESRRRASEAVRGAGQAVGEKAKGLGVATAEKVDGAIVSGVNALETGARAIADTARRVTPSEESRRRASEAVRGAGQAVGEKAKGL
ncbi:MAG: hypothetical protein OXK80_01350, partial [Bdellovibrionales bacterium]|nr:hypothetical protein [Bdellovibrionales bacterium]